MGRGGKRAGAGRPRKFSQRTMFADEKSAHGRDPATVYASAADYLSAVAQGLEEPCAERIAAARAMLPYERPVVRPKAKAETPTRMQQQHESGTEETRREEWRRRSEEIRKRHQKE